MKVGSWVRVRDPQKWYGLYQGTLVDNYLILDTIGSEHNVLYAVIDIGQKTHVWFHVTDLIELEPLVSHPMRVLGPSLWDRLV